MYPNTKSCRQHNFVLLKIWQSLTLNWGCLDLFLFILNPICSCFFLPLFLTFLELSIFHDFILSPILFFSHSLLFQWLQQHHKLFSIIHRFICNTRNLQPYDSGNTRFYALGLCAAAVILFTFTCYKPRSTFSLVIFFVVVEYRNIKCTVLTTLKCTI